jgi:hypothetical protein
MLGVCLRCAVILAASADTASGAEAQAQGAGQPAATVGETTEPAFAKLSLEPLDPVCPGGLPSEAEPLPLRFRATNRDLVAITTTTAIILESTGTVSKPLAVPQIDPNGTRLIAFELERPLTAGDHELQVVLTRNVNDQPATGTFPMRLHVNPAADLEFVPGSGRARSTTGFVAQSTVFLDATLKNKGGATARGISLQCQLQDVEGTPPEMASINETNTGSIDELKPGEERAVTFRWENPRAPGEQHVLMTANAGHGIRETNYENNSIAIEPFTIRQLGNFTVAGFETSPTMVTSGKDVVVSATVLDMVTMPHGSVDIELGLRNLMAQSDSISTHVQVSRGPDGLAAASALFQMASPYNAAYVKVNPGRELEEDDVDDNTTQSGMLIEVPVSGLPRKLKGTTSMNQLFPLCWCWNMDAVTTNLLELSAQLTSSTGMMPVLPSHWVLGWRRPPNTRLAESDDDVWTLGTYRLEASYMEDAGEIQLRVPMVPPGAKWPFQIYARSSSSANFFGGPVGAFDAKVGHGEWKNYNNVGHTGDVAYRAPLTTTTLESGNLDISVRQIKGTGVQITAFEAVAQAGTVQSPILLLDGKPKPAKVVAKVSGATSEGVWIQIRYKGGDGTWTDWSTHQGLIAEIPGQASAIQWQLSLQPDPLKRTVRLIDVQLTP